MLDGVAESEMSIWLTFRPSWPAVLRLNDHPLARTLTALCTRPVNEAPTVAVVVPMGRVVVPVGRVLVDLDGRENVSSPAALALPSKAP